MAMSGRKIDGSQSKPRGVHHLRRHRCRRHHRPLQQGAGDAAADRRCLDRGGQCRCRGGAYPCAQPRDRQRRARRRALRGGDEPHQEVRRRHDHQLHRRHGRRPDAGQHRKADAAVAGRHRHGRRHRTARACRQAAAGNLHARLRHHEFRRRRLRHDQHAGHAEGDGRADPGATASSRRSRSSTPAICCSPNGCTGKACSTTR